MEFNSEHEAMIITIDTEKNPKESQNRQQDNQCPVPLSIQS